MPDDENEDTEAVSGNGNGKTKNRASKDISEPKTIFALLTWNECSQSITLDSKDLDDLMYQKILTWLTVFPNDYGNIILEYIKNDKSLGTNKLKSDKMMAELALAFPVLPVPVAPKTGAGAYVRFAKKSYADIKNYLSPYWCDPSNSAKVSSYFYKFNPSLQIFHSFRKFNIFTDRFGKWSRR